MEGGGRRLKGEGGGRLREGEGGRGTLCFIPNCAVGEGDSRPANLTVLRLYEWQEWVSGSEKYSWVKKLLALSS